MSGKMILKILLVTVIFTAFAVLFIGAYGGILHPQHELEFYVLTATTAVVGCAISPAVLL